MSDDKLGIPSLVEGLKTPNEQLAEGILILNDKPMAK